MKKIFRVFLSSTFTDLENERKEVTQALLESDCMPTGMEMFHAADKKQWKLIQNEICSCDFYIVIIAGRYGSVHPETNISYTQMEYEYAYKIGIPIFAFIYKNPDDLPAKKIERKNIYQKKLNEFKKRILNERMVKFWINPYDLASSVKTSIFRAIKDNPPGGWVRYKDIVNNRSDNINTLELLNQINELKNLILENCKDTIENEKKENTLRNSELLNQLNELKNIITSNDNANNISTDAKEKIQAYSSNLANEYIYKINSKNITFSLNSMHVDALKEITNMMFSAGITGLSEFFRIPIRADYSYLQICKNSNDVDKFIVNRDKYCMLSEFYADNLYDNKSIYGKIYFNFSLKVVNEIFCMLGLDASHYIDNSVYDYFKSAFYEISNIFIGASLTALSMTINLKLQMSATINNVDIKKINLFKNDDTILISKFSNSINEPNLIDAYLILESTSVKSLLEETFGETIS